MQRKKLQIDSGAEALSMDVKMEITAKNCGWYGSETT